MILFALAVLGVFVYKISAILTPFLVATILAYLTNSWVVFLQKLHLNRTVSVVIVFLVLLGLFILSLIFLIPALEQQVINLVQALPSIIMRIKQDVLPWMALHFNLTLDFEQNGWQGTVQNICRFKFSSRGVFNQFTIGTRRFILFTT
jgi:predicted PurR-regulated permease PerM